MSKENLIRLTKYANDVKSKLSDKVLPEKQKNRPAQYKLFLERELAAVNSKIEALKMGAPTESKK
jgi:hypothetical protein